MDKKTILMGIQRMQIWDKEEKDDKIYRHWIRVRVKWLW